MNMTSSYAHVIVPCNRHTYLAKISYGSLLKFQAYHSEGHALNLFMVTQNYNH